MTTFGWMAVAVGGLALAGKMAELLAPVPSAAWVKRFPRSRFWALTLTAVDLAAVCWLVWILPTNAFTPYRAVLIAAYPVAFYLVVRFVDELLAARALGGLMLLAASPILNASRLHYDNQARLVMVVLAYVWVVLGMLFVASPWWFRKLTDPVVDRPCLFRASAVLGVVFGATLIALGIWVY